MPQSNLDVALNELTRAVVALRRDVDRLKANASTTNLGRSSIDNGRLETRVDGVTTSSWGEQPDGTTATVYVPGPIPPVPTAPGVTPILGGVDVYWDGGLDGARPHDFSHVLVYASPDGPGFVLGEATLYGSLHRVGTHPVVPLDAVEHWVKLVAVSTSGVESAPSSAASAVPEEAVAGELLDGAVTELKLADDAVTAAKIAAGAVGTAELGDASVDVAKLADGSVGAAKLVAGSVGQDALAVDAVTAAKIAAGAVGADELAANSVVAGKIAADSVGASQLTAGSVQAEKIAAGAVAADKLAANSVTAEKILGLSVTADKLAANSVVAGKIDAGAVTAAKLAADIVLASRIRMQNPSGQTTLDLNGATGDALFKGQYRTADTGERIVINDAAPAGYKRISFYPQLATNPPSIIQSSIAEYNDVFNGGVDIRSAPTEDNAISGRMRVGATQAELFAGSAPYYNSQGVLQPENSKSKVVAGTDGYLYIHGTDTVSIKGSRVALRATQEYGQTSTNHFQFVFDNPGGTAFPDWIRFMLNGPSGRPAIGNPATNTGLLLGNGTVFITDANGNGARAISASNVSSRSLKDNVQPLPFAASAVVADAPVSEWQYKTDESGTRFIGVMVDDLPDQLVIGDGEERYPDLNNMLMTLWEAVRQLNHKVGELTRCPESA